MTATTSHVPFLPTYLLARRACGKSVAAARLTTANASGASFTACGMLASFSACSLLASFTASPIGPISTSSLTPLISITRKYASPMPALAAAAALRVSNACSSASWSENPSPSAPYTRHHLLPSV